MNRVRRSIIVAVAVAVVLAACSSAAETDNAASNEGPLDWSRCFGDFECATLNVPIDRNDASVGNVDLAMIRLRALDPAKRIGPLVINPGGPGVSAVDVVKAFGPSLATSIRERFDIVGFDPRGVGASSPIDCGVDAAEFVAVDPSPDDDAEWNIAMDNAQSFGAACAAEAGPLLAHMGTVDAARDMDAVRAALGADDLSYLGFSYGTRLGATYAELYPERVRAFVLDGAVDPTLGAIEFAATQAVGFERALESYFEWCKDNGCNWSDGKDPAAAFDAIVSRSDQSPIPSPRERAAGPGEFSLGVTQGLYGGEESWSTLTRALDEADEGDGSALVALTDQYLATEPDGTYPNTLDAYFAIVCTDVTPPTIDEIVGARADLSARSPRFGSSLLIEASTCAAWPAQANPHGAVSGRGAAPILILNTTGDPATPREWGAALSSQLDSGVLVTYEGEGHTIYATGRSICVDDIVDKYLIDLEAPPNGTVCQ